MTLAEMIFHRKSCRSFSGQPVDAEMLEKAGLEMPPAIEIRDKAGLPEQLTTADDIADYIAKLQ